MTISLRQSMYLALAVFAAVLLTAAPFASAQGSRALRGKVVIDGSSTVYPVSEAVASAFRKHFPNVKVTVAVSGTGGGFKRFVVGETDISNASRPMKFEEFKQAAANGVEFIEIPVALDGLTIVVSPDNDWVDALTVEQLRKIYLAESAAKTWKELDPSWPDRPIKVYSPGTESGTFDYFHEVMGEDAALRSDMATSEDDNVLVTGVQRDKYAIGYFGASYYYNNEDKLKAVAIVNPDSGEAVLPTEENVKGGSYVPFARPLFIYVSKKALTRPEVKVFCDYYLREADKMATKVDYVPLSESMYERVGDIYRARRTGTTYLTADGEKRAGRLPEVYQKENLLKLTDIEVDE
ncbi:MAG: PstS family phosphate ABC transporter substrate-binding protein [Phycisphaeraceae bacterium]|nr:PstS family phosphate ABC transporter substrate-binding protein [Phycisphaeraceae bacterium]